MNCAPHGEILSFDRLYWIALSLFLYSTFIGICYGIPMHLLLRKLDFTASIFYLAAGAFGPAVTYTVLYRLIQGEFWPGGMVEPLAYNVFVGSIIGWYFHRQAYSD